MKTNFYKISVKYFGFVFLLVFSIIILFLFASPDSMAKKETARTKTHTAMTESEKLEQQIELIKGNGDFTYGKSGLGVGLKCYKFSPAVKSKKKLLLTFEIHGYEDDYPKDGQVLVDIGNALVQYFSKNQAALKDCELFIVPSANPDGLAHGVSNNGIGRCQVSLGVNINRDFNYCFKVESDSRNHTLNKPFAAPESKALKNLVEAIHPDAVIDLHGWESGFIGDSSLSGSIRKYLNGYSLRYNKPQFSQDENGFFSAWAGTKCKKALLVEYPPIATQQTDLYTQETIAGIKEVINSALC